MSEAQEVLTRLRRTKEELVKLEDLYRKICECNNRLPGTENLPLNTYQKLYDTCDYHQLRIRHG